MERWEQVETILQEALDRPPQERAQFVERACAGDAELWAETTSLIRAHDEAGDFIEQPAIVTDARVLVGDQPDVSIGLKVGPYSITRRLGAGGMGEVYLAEDTRLNRLVALKILPGFFVSDAARLHRFQREARAASALNHPNILTIHEVGEADGIHFIATEFIDGQTLRELIVAAELSLAEVLDVAVQVASALATAHAAGIIHRDIKPENIMRREDGIVKILDFGIAKLVEPSPREVSQEGSTLIKAQTETGVVMGTVGYMSPEQARGIFVDERTDLWSMGVVLYEMLARRAPFAGDTRMDTLVSILEREPPPLFRLSVDAPPELEQLQRIVHKLLRKKTAERYRSATELLAELKNVKQELDLAARLKPDLSASTIINSHATMRDAQPKQSFMRRPLLLALVLIAGLLLAGFAGNFFYKRAMTRRNQSASAQQKLYAEMSEAQQLAFIDEQEQRISAIMGDRPVKLNEEAIRAIKARIDRYAARRGSMSDELGKEDLRVIYARAVSFIPLIERSFAARKVPVIIGIYLPMIESEYNLCYENYNGAKGMFQFMPRTAQAYGVAHEEMCDVEKMTPAAAHYLADRMAELGDDSESMTLVLLSYNTAPEWVRNALRQLRNTENYKRNFWTLFAHRDQLDEHFRAEGAAYVPSFFAAAIIGENPQAFGLQTPPLSTLTSAGGAGQ